MTVQAVLKSATPYHLPMTGVLPTRTHLRRDPAVRALTTAWRDLTGGRRRSIPDIARRTLVACSAGADSSALAIALAQSTDDLVLAHIVHDLREPEAALADRDAARALADSLNLPFAESHVRVPRANQEAEARTARYNALVSLARRHECPFIATAHHAGDDLETLLMGLVRGSGPAGLGGIHQQRAVDGATIIRPMLGIDRQDAERICALAEWAWRDDETNDDTTRLRAALRHTVVPALRAIRPDVASRAATSARLMRDADAVIQDRVDLLWHGPDHGPVVLDRRTVASERPIVIGALLRQVIQHLRNGAGQDRMGAASILPVAEAIADGQRHPRTFTLSQIEILVDRDQIRVGVQHA